MTLTARYRLARFYNACFEKGMILAMAVALCCVCSGNIPTFFLFIAAGAVIALVALLFGQLAVRAERRL